jgi:hypothetical protein
VLLITQGKTKAARRVFPLSPRVRSVLENRWKLAKQPGEGWVWPAETNDEHINHDSVKLQHKKALKLAKIRPYSRSTQSGIHSSPGSERAAVTPGPLRGSRDIRISAFLNGTFILPRMQSLTRFHVWVGTILGTASKTRLSHSQGSCRQTPITMRVRW